MTSSCHPDEKKTTSVTDLSPLLDCDMGINTFHNKWRFGAGTVIDLSFVASTWYLHNPMKKQRE